MSFLQKDDDKLFRKDFCSHNQNTERSKKRTLEVFTLPQSEKLFRVALLSNQNNPCSKRIFYSGKKKVVEAMTKSRRTLESSTTTTATAEEVAAHFKNHHVNTVAISMETFSNKLLKTISMNRFIQ